ncbi:hypothetical protein [Mucilaginibacter pallidiroseus]|nr:hypothetical protein [Mucilaginibacter pallidiroseus]
MKKIIVAAAFMITAGLTQSCKNQVSIKTFNAVTGHSTHAIFKNLGTAD